MKDDTRNKKNEVNDREAESLSQDDHQKNKEIALIMLDTNYCNDDKTMASISFILSILTFVSHYLFLPEVVTSYTVDL